MKHVLVCEWNARVVNEGTSQLKARGGISKFSHLLACVRIDTEHPRVGDDGATIHNQAPLVLETTAQVAQIQPRHTIGGGPYALQNKSLLRSVTMEQPMDML